MIYVGRIVLGRWLQELTSYRGGKLRQVDRGDEFDSVDEGTMRGYELLALYFVAKQELCLEKREVFVEQTSMVC